MALIRGGSEADLFFVGGGFGPADWQVREFHGVEAMSDLFSYTIRLISSVDDIVIDDVAGCTGTLSWKTDDGSVRNVHGLIARFEHVGHGPSQQHYEIQLVPRFWTLGLRRDCKIFHPNKTTPVILKALFEAADFVENEDFILDLQETYTPREYCVQYRESDLDFALRLMEEEGICFYFKHGEAKDLFYACDQINATAAIEGEPTLPFREKTALVEESEAVYAFRFGRSVRPTIVHLLAHDFRRPSSRLRGTVGMSALPAEQKLIQYDYPGKFVDADSTGAHLAAAQIGSLTSLRALGRGESDCRRFVAGSRFTLDQFPRDDANREYTFVRVEHWGHQKPEGEEAGNSEEEEPPYGNRFECIPSDVLFRPARVTPLARVDGPQTARVTGPAGEEIWTDEFGRIKVLFHWDHHGADDATSSCWVPVRQNWAGAGWGAVWIPRIGQEVIIEFLEGDPDHPICTGAVYNGSNATPYTLPDEKTKSTIKSCSTPGGGGSNEIRFEDAKGAEQVYVHAQLNMDTIVEADRTVTVGHDETHTVKHDRVLTVENDQTFEVMNDQSGTVGNNDTLKVVANQELKVGGNLSIDVGGSRIESVGAVSSIRVGASHSLVVGGAVAIEVGAALSEKVGAAHDSEVSGASTRTVSGADSLTISGASSVSVSGDRTVEVGGAYGLNVSGASTWETADGLTIKAKKIAMEAEESVLIKTGEASIEMKRDGTITIKGKDIKFDGSSGITIKAPKTGID